MKLFYLCAEKGVFFFRDFSTTMKTGRQALSITRAAGGYPWLVIPAEKRSRYMETLEHASVGRNIVPFTKFLAGLLNRGVSE